MIRPITIRLNNTVETHLLEEDCIVTDLYTRIQIKFENISEIIDVSYIKACSLEQKKGKLLDYCLRLNPRKMWQVFTD